MNLLDFLIVIPLFYFSYRGFVNGIIKEVLSIAGIILGVFLTFEYMDNMSALVRPFFDEDASYIPFISGAILFIGTVGAVQLAAYLAKKFLETIKLNFINRLAGMVFGFLKSGIMVSALLLILAGFNLPSDTARGESITYSTIIYLAPLTYDAVALIYPGATNFSNTIGETFDQYNPIDNFPILN